MSVSGRGTSTGRLRGPSRRALWFRPLVGSSLLALVGWRLGWVPFLDAVQGIGPSSLAAAAAIGAVTTVCCAWRWSLVARTLGVVLPLRCAVSACYRSQFVNVATPGGVVGDALRGVETGRSHGDTLLGVRSVVWERFVGQSVQVLLALVALLALPSPVPHSVVWGVVVVLGGALVLLTRVRNRVLGEARLLLSRSVWPGLALASALVVGGHVATFLVAAHSAGSTAPTLRVVPVALLVLVTSALPVNVAGWGPREGAAAWAFGAAGLGGGLGVSTAVVFGVLALVSSLPGAVFVVVAALRRRRGLRRRTAMGGAALAGGPGLG